MEAAHPLAPDIPDALPAGTRLRDYTIRQVLGHGGFGLTYLADDEVFRREVAVKEFLPADLARRFADGRVGPRTTTAQTDYDWGLEEFLQEAQLLDRLEHPGVVRVRAFFKENATAYLVMELVPGPTLAAHLGQQGLQGQAGRLGVDDTRTLLSALAAALAHVHARGCLHRDVKPENVILRNGRIDDPVLIDFGAARKAVAERTRMVAAIVSPGYSPLEQYAGSRSLTAASDLYALAALGWRCLNGEDPPPATERAQHDQALPSLQAHARRPEDRPWLQALDEGLALRLAQRPADLGPLLQALGAASGQAAPALPPQPDPSGVGTESSGAGGAGSGGPSAAADELLQRAAARDRHNPTLRIAPLADAATPAAAVHAAAPHAAGLPPGVVPPTQVAGTGATHPVPLLAPSGTAAATTPGLPSLALQFWLALLVATGGTLLRLALHHAGWLPNKELALESRLLQSLLLFPAAAVAGAALAGVGARWLGLPLRRAWAWLLLMLLAYALVSVFATYAQALLTYDGYEPLTPLPMYMLMATAAPWEFGVYALGFIGLHALARRRTAWAEPQAPRLLRPALLPALLALVGTVATVTLRYQDRHAAESARRVGQELVRAGLLLAPDDEAQTERAIRQLQARSGLREDGRADERLWDKARALPTRTRFTVGAEQADFTRVEDALAFLGHSRWDNIREREAKDAAMAFEIRLLPGRHVVGESRTWAPRAPWQRITLAPAAAAGSAIVDLGSGQPTLQVERLTLKGLNIVGTPSTDQLLTLELGAQLLDSTLRSAQPGRYFVLRVGNKTADDVERPQIQITGNTIGDSVLVEGQAELRGNIFDSRGFAIKTDGDARVVLAGNAYRKVGSNLLWATGKSEVTLQEEALLSTTPGAHPPLMINGQARMTLAGGRLATSAPKACAVVVDQGALQIDGASIGPCGTGQWPLFVGPAGHLTVKNSVFDASAGADIGQQINLAADPERVQLSGNRVGP